MSKLPNLLHWTRCALALTLSSSLVWSGPGCSLDSTSEEGNNEQEWLDQQHGEVTARAGTPSASAIDASAQAFLNGLPDRVAQMASTTLVREPGAESIQTLSTSFQSAFQSKVASGALGARLRSDTAVIGSLPGTLSVDDAGHSTYNVALSFAPGREGLEPNLGLRYNSADTEGQLGVGWALSLPSAFYPCDPWASKLVEDSNFFATDRASVSDAKQRICYGGLPIVHAKGGEDDATGAPGYYHTVPDTGVRIEKIFLGAPGDAGVGGELVAFRVDTVDNLRLRLPQILRQSSI